MKTVISASRRTDIPAFYLDWFIDKIQKGFIETINPFNPKQIRRVSLSPRDVQWIVFWSRDYRRFLNKRAAFKNFNLFFHFTILPKSDFEKAGINVSSAIEQIKQLSGLYNADRIIWRYDPLVYWIENNRLQSNHHIEKFEELCFKISNAGLKRCYFSFVHPYKKFTERMRDKFPDREIVNPEGEEKIKILHEMQKTAKKYNIQLYACSNSDLLTIPGIEKGHCIDGTLLNKLSDRKIVSEAKAPSRPDCGCTKSIDIGNYTQHPCHFGCIYCYANPVWK